MKHVIEWMDFIENIINLVSLITRIERYIEFVRRQVLIFDWILDFFLFSATNNFHYLAITQASEWTL